MLESQKKKIDSVDWDYLLVLDACRFDYFRDIYEQYLSGELEKVHSPVSCEKEMATSEWCKAVFGKNYDDIIYVSASPMINSKEEVTGFKGSDHFHEVVDVWDWGWNEERGTVLPETVNSAVLEVRKENPDKRIVAHYLQPHFPYLGLKEISFSRSKSPKDRESKWRKIRNLLGSKLRKVLGGRRTIKLMKILGLPSVNPMDKTVREVGEEGLREAYHENLRIVLRAVKSLLNQIEGKTIITSDHGEYLGENGFYGHSYLPDHSVLIHVPWFKVE